MFNSRGYNNIISEALLSDELGEVDDKYCFGSTVNAVSETIFECQDVKLGGDMYVDSLFSAPVVILKY